MTETDMANPEQVRLEKIISDTLGRCYAQQKLSEHPHGKGLAQVLADNNFVLPEELTTCVVSGNLSHVHTVATLLARTLILMGHAVERQDLYRLSLVLRREDCDIYGAFEGAALFVPSFYSAHSKPTPNPLPWYEQHAVERLVQERMENNEVTVLAVAGSLDRANEWWSEGFLTYLRSGAHIMVIK